MRLTTPTLSLPFCPSEGMSLPSSNWSVHNNTGQKQFYRISFASTCYISHCLSVNSDPSWTLLIHGQQVSHQNCSLLLSFPIKLTQAHLQSLINTLEHASVCPGNPDIKFVEMINDKTKKGKIWNASGKSTVAALDSLGGVSVGGQQCIEIVRTATCELLTTSPRCCS